MSTEQFNVMRKELVENVTGAALDWLAYMGAPAALAAIPDTEPPRYVVAGTLADIVKLLPAAEVIRPNQAAPASPEQVQAELSDRDTLAFAIARAAERRGIIGANTALTGPHLIMLCDALAAPIAAAPAAREQARNEALEKEVEQLKAMLEKRHKANFIMSQSLHNVLVGNQSAWIEWQHGAGAEAAMAWIHNGLVGPGLIPDGKEAQPWFDANVDDRYEIPPMVEAPAASKEGDAA